jgi:hypothetical protein
VFTVVEYEKYPKEIQDQAAEWHASAGFVAF